MTEIKKYIRIVSYLHQELVCEDCFLNYKCPNHCSSLAKTVLKSMRSFDNTDRFRVAPLQFHIHWSYVAGLKQRKQRFRVNHPSPHAIFTSCPPSSHVISMCNVTLLLMLYPCNVNVLPMLSPYHVTLLPMLSPCAMLHSCHVTLLPMLYPCVMSPFSSCYIHVMSTCSSCYLHDMPPFSPCYLHVPCYPSPHVISMCHATLLPMLYPCAIPSFSPCYLHVMPPFFPCYIHVACHPSPHAI